MWLKKSPAGKLSQLNFSVSSQDSISKLPAIVDSSTEFQLSLRILGMSWGVKTTSFEAPGVSLGGSGVSIEGGDGFLGSVKSFHASFFSFTMRFSEPF